METTPTTTRTILAAHAKAGDLITHERRRYTIESVGVAVQYRPRQDAVTVTRLMLRPARQAGGKLVKVSMPTDQTLRVARRVAS